MKSLLLFTSILLLAACFVGKANAAIVVITFSGDITSIDDPTGELMGSGIDNATTFSGIISYDTTLDPIHVSILPDGGERAIYDSTIAVVTIAGFDFSVSDQMSVANYSPGTGSDALRKSVGGSPASCYGSINSCGLDVSFLDTSGQLYSDTSLPSSVSFNDFDVRTLLIIAFGDAGVLYQIDGIITSLDFQSTPGPLPDGSTLSIEPGVGSNGIQPCTTGSCFGMEISPGLPLWTDIAAGTDGGIIVGKDQASGGQENFPALDISGELTAAWSFFDSWGTFATLPGAALNLFSDANCTGEGCIDQTELKVFDMHWNGYTMQLGSENGCNSGNCNTDHLANIFTTNYSINLDSNGVGGYELHWSNVVPDGHASGFGGVTFSLILRGNAVEGVASENIPPSAGDVVVNDVFAGEIIRWGPVVFDANGDTLSCSLVTPPANGLAAVNNDCSFGEYIAVNGFIGTDTFTYRANDGQLNSAPATVAVNVIERTACDSYPVRQVTSLGGGQSVTENAEVSVTFTGRITTEKGLTGGARNTVKICPETTVSYLAIATTGEAVCLLNNSATEATGIATVGDKLVCTNRPGGGDTDRFSIKNGL